METNDPNKYGYPNLTKISVLNLSDIIGHIFILSPQWDVQKVWVHIAKIIDDRKKLYQYSGDNQFVFSVHDYQSKKIISYNSIIDHIENQ